MRSMVGSARLLGSDMLGVGVGLGVQAAASASRGRTKAAMVLWDKEKAPLEAMAEERSGELWHERFEPVAHLVPYALKSRMLRRFCGISIKFWKIV